MNNFSNEVIYQLSDLGKCDAEVRIEDQRFQRYSWATPVGLVSLFSFSSSFLSSVCSFSSPPPNRLSPPWVVIVRGGIDSLLAEERLQHAMCD
jgi:hypothetical protein